MSRNGDSYQAFAQAVFDGAATQARLFNDFMTKVTAATMSNPGEFSTPDKMREIRGAVLQAWGDYYDEIVRSPQFLEFMKQSMSATIAVRKQLNENLRRTHDQWQTLSRQDMDELVSKIQGVEERILDAHERLSRRLDDIADRLEALENGRRAGSPKVAKPKGRGKRAVANES